MKVQILCDNAGSWMNAYIDKFVQKLEVFSKKIIVRQRHEDVETGDVLLLLSCEKFFKNTELNKYNLVVHESELPKGKGWSPLTWQVLEGSNRIAVTLFEAAANVDSGDIYEQTFIELDGTELVDELREKQAMATLQVVEAFFRKYPDVKGKPQEGAETFYPRRKPADSALDISKSIADQFNLLRVSDNERYPAFFSHLGEKYILKIEKADK